MAKKIKKSKNESKLIQGIPESIFEPLNLNLEELLKSSSGFQVEEPVKVEDELAKRERLKNVDIEQDIKLKKLTLKILLLFLGVETFIIFGFAFLQATILLNFKLEDWSFRLLVSVTITQIYLMLRIAVEYLFPKNK